VIVVTFLLRQSASHQLLGHGIRFCYTRRHRRGAAWRKFGASILLLRRHAPPHSAIRVHYEGVWALNIRITYLVPLAALTGHVTTQATFEPADFDHTAALGDLDVEVATLPSLRATLKRGLTSHLAHSW
jgi:hypothetical protein